MKSLEKKLLKIFSRLTEIQQQTLLQFAEFLAERGDDTGVAKGKTELPKPVLAKRPTEETVVGAIKRLTSSYPMLEKDKLFNETSILMTKHVMQGHAANLVIDELEILFQRHYEALISDQQQDSEQ
ncbi:MAG: Crp/Fnr family transcriptional regulator [Gammaproteobacteria bacterium]|nr:Crp/Fnr family transcriptional regulator [Gammaproteobacteria bacterium]